ncbi:MAG: DEAD/DEAH box helicase, partial [Ruminococcaceae bacterium]|nr:DEAD/DEAH box helicase [Oscillospiraceae bacterium]
MAARHTPQSPVTELPSVGATRQKQLQKLGINTFEDLIYLYPKAYEKRGNVKLLSEIELEKKEALILTVGTEVSSAAIRRGMTISKFKAFDDSGVCEVVFFNSPYVKDIFHTGAVFRFFGKATLAKNKIQLVNPKYEPIIPGKELPPLVPIYPLTDGISSKFIDKITRIAIDSSIAMINDPLPDDIRIKYSLPVLSYALKNVHFPESEEALSKALSRLAFDEMLTFGIGISLSSGKRLDINGVSFSPCDLTPLTNLLPYELTRSQKNAVNDIYKDTVIKKADGKIRPMTRILVGDVGSGKTICAVMAIYIAAKSGYQSALMAPTEILARQHFQDVKALFEKLNVKTELLLGSTSQKEKKRIYSELKNNEIQVIIGTHALISDNVDFSNLGLVITDEQHRFGVAQRATLKDKSKNAHMLVMSATPIPRSLALTMYGDLDISRITEMPKGRMRVDTFAVDDSYRDRLNSFISKQVEKGGQCYIVCPSIEPAE